MPIIEYETDRVMEVVREVQRSIPDLEKIHGGLRIDQSAVLYAGRLAGFHYDPNLTGDGLKKKVLDIVEQGCKLLKVEINKDRNEIWLDEHEYMLRRALVEHHEIVKERDARNDCYILHLEKEIENSKLAFEFFRTKWKPLFSKWSNFFYRSLIKVIVITRNLRSKGVSEFDSVDDLREIVTHIDMLLRHFPRGHMDLVTLFPTQVGEVVSRETGIPLPWVNLPKMRNVRKKALQQLSEKLLGLDHVIKALRRVFFSEDPIILHRRNFTTCPFATFLFLGEHGSGKAEVARGLARYFYSDVNRLIRIDMSEYEGPHSVPSLLKSPNLLDDEWKEFCLGRLMEAFSDRPYSLIYIENIEKAHPSVVEILLELVAKGALADSLGNKIEFSNSIIIMSSVVGAKQLRIRCTCRMSNEHLEEFSMNRQSFQHNHDCPTLANAGTIKQRIVEEARSLICPDLLKLLDDIVVFPVIFSQNRRGVSQFMLRAMAKDSTHNDDVVVHASGSLLEIGWLLDPTPGIHSAKRLKNWLYNNIMPHLSMHETNVCCPSLCIDTLAGTKDLSFRLETNKTLVEDWFYKHWKEYLHEWRNSYQREKKLFLELCRLRTCCARMEVGLEDVTSFFEAISSLTICLHCGSWCDLLHDSFEALGRCRMTNYSVRAMAKDVENIRKRLLQKTSGQLVIDAVKETVVKAVGAPEDLPNRPAGVYMFVGLDRKSKMELFSCLTESLRLDDGETLFAPKPGSWNESFTDVRWMLDLVKKRPHSVLLFEEIGSADAAFYSTLLKVLDNGLIADADGSFVDFRYTTIIFVAGVGDRIVLAKLFCSLSVEDGRPVSYSFGSTQQDVKPFRSELPFRMDEIFFFEPSNLKDRRILRFSLTEPAHFKSSCGQLQKFFYYLFRKSLEEEQKREERVIDGLMIYMRVCGRIRSM